MTSLSLTLSYFLFWFMFICLNLFIFNWRIIALQYCVGFCHTSRWVSHRYTYVPSLWVGDIWTYIWTSLLPPTPSHSSRLSQSTSLSSLPHAANPHWLSVLLTVMYMFPCCSLHSSPLPFSPCVHKSASPLLPRK